MNDFKKSLELEPALGPEINKITEELSYLKKPRDNEHQHPA